MKIFTKIKNRILTVGSSLMVVLIPLVVRADDTGLPWDDAGNILIKSLTGPVAKFISIAALVGAMAKLMFGGEISDFTRKMLMLVILMSGLFFASTILSVLFGV